MEAYIDLGMEQFPSYILRFVACIYTYMWPGERYADATLLYSCARVLCCTLQLPQYPKLGLGFSEQSPVSDQVGMAGIVFLRFSY